MDGATGCPHTERLKELLAGRLGDEAQNRLTGHLDTCETCRAALDELSGQRRLVSALAGLTQSDRATRVPALQQAIARLKAIGAHQSTQADAPDATLLGEEISEHLSLDFLEPSENPEHLGRLGEYEVVEVIGCGGMGVVLKAHDPTLDRFVAVKVLSPVLASNATARKRFLREARAAAAVSHEHVVAIHAVGETGGLPFLVMEYVHGRSLRERIDAEGPLAVEDVLRVGYQTAMGLAGAHAQGLIHRDIKPANILLEDGGGRVCITDFGLARAADDVQITRSGVVAGTPQYMSPEQARGKPVDPRSDLFSLGCVMYAMCTGRPPFAASSVLDAMRRVAEEEPPPIDELAPDTPDWLVEIIARLLAKEREARFQSAAEVADFFGRHLAHLQQPDVIPPPPRLSAFVRKPRRHRRRVRFVAVALALVLVGLGVTDATGVTHVADYLATVLRIRTPHGTLIVKIYDPDVNVVVDADGEEIALEGVGEHEVTLRPGRHQWQAVRDGVVGQSQWVTIERGGEKVVEVVVQPYEPPAGWIDLLSRVDLKRDALDPRWTAEGHALVSNPPAGKPFARLQIPYVPPEEYDLEVEVERRSGRDCFALGLVVGARQATLAIDGHGLYGNMCGLQQIDGRWDTDNETAVVTKLLVPGKRTQFSVAVRKSGVRFTSGDRVLIDWKGNPDRLSLRSCWAMPNQECLFLGSYASSFKITKLDLKPVSGKGRWFFSAEGSTNPERFAAERVLWKGGGVWVRVDDAPLVAARRVAELPASFQLAGVDLCGSKDIDRAGLGFLHGLDGIERLDLAETPIADEDFAASLDLPELVELDLSFTRITDAALARIRHRWPRLRWLVLDHTGVSDAGMAELAGLPCLENLSLAGTDVSDAGLANLHSLDRLEHLSLLGTAVTQKGVEDINQALPNCRVEHGSKYVDLLELIDPSRDSVRETWRREAGALVSPDCQYARIQIPYLVPEEYDLEVEAELRSSGTDCFVLGLVSGGRQGHLAREGRRAGLLTIDERWDAGNESKRFPPDSRLRFTASVRKSGVRVTSGGIVAIDWRGSPDRLAVRPWWAVPNQGCLFLGSNNCCYRISKLYLAPVTGQGQPLFADREPDRLVAEHVLWKGGQVSVSVGGGPPIAVRRIADLPQSFRLTGVNLRGKREMSRSELESITELDLPALAELDLGLTLAVDVSLEHVKDHSPSLRRLELSGTAITDDGLRRIARLTQLEDLDLRGTRVSDHGLMALNGLSELKRLILDHTRVTDAGLEHLGELAHLEYLSLVGTEVSDAGLHRLHKLESLKELCLIATATGVSEEGVAALEKALPGCKVVANAGEAVDLLKLIDPSRDSVRGVWRLEADGLLSPGVDCARLQIPYSPPEEYAIEMVAQRVSGPHGMVLGLVAGGQQAVLHIDGWPHGGPKTALATIDGTDAFYNETAAPSAVFPGSEPARLLLIVRKSRVTLARQRRVLIDWQVDPKRLSLRQEWTVPSPRALFIGDFASTFKISRMRLIPISGTGQVLIEPHSAPPED